MNMWEANDEATSTPVEGTMPSHEEWLASQPNEFEASESAELDKAWASVNEMSQADIDHLDTMGFARGE